MPKRTMANRQPVKELNEHDVLFGRGSGTALFVGNKSFRSLIEDDKTEYNACTKRAKKNEIATRLLQKIHSRGGRFLRLLDESAMASSKWSRKVDIVKEGVWYEVNRHEAVEKIKQSLRRQKEEEPKKRGLSLTSSGIAGSGGAMQAEEETLSSHPPSFSSDATALALALSRLPPIVIQSLLSPSVVHRGNGVSIDDPQLLLFQSLFPSVLQQQHALSGVVPNIPSTTMSPSSLLSEALNMAFSQQQRRQQQQQQRQIPNPSLHTTSMYPGISSIDVQSTSSFPSMRQQRHEFSSVASDIPSNKVSPTAFLPEALSGTTFSLQGQIPQRSPVTPFQHQQSAAYSPIHKEQQRYGCRLEDLSVHSWDREGAEDDDKNQKPSDEDASVFLKSVLQLSGLPRFTGNDVEREEASMTEVEKAAALADVFGRYFSVDSHRNKRARRDHANPHSNDTALRPGRNSLDFV